ncbi:MAG: SURF1 family protein [Novosphingobium sp.]|nr:SURF1 family protein [Novosphingobium sp.]
MQRLPVIPTIVVLLAVGMMIRLGLWQIDRMHEKEALLARYAAAASSRDEVEWSRDDDAAQERLYARSRINCVSTSNGSAIAGKSATGESGLAITVSCLTEHGDPALVVLGWSREPKIPQWGGGEVAGVIAPGPRLVADPPLAGLEASAMPDPRDVPNNHWSYAVQWFLFAFVALVIYALAVRKRLA